MILKRDDYFRARPPGLEVSGVFEAAHCGRRAVPAWHRNQFKGWTCMACLQWFPARLQSVSRRRAKKPVSRKIFNVYEKVKKDPEEERARADSA